MIDLLFSGKRKRFTITLIVLFLLFISSSFSQEFKPQNNVLQNTVTPTVSQQPTSKPTAHTIFPTDKLEDVQSGPQDMQSATVLRVVDGDTIVVSINGKEETLRIIGINSPESVDPRRGVQCFGVEASNYVKQQLTGKQVYLESDPSQQERDKYNRLLRFVFLSDGVTDFGKSLIANGYAYEYTYQTPYKYQALYKQAQSTAQQQKKGLWADDTCSNQQSTINTQQLTNDSQKNITNTDEDKDCKDFGTQQEAQEYFDSRGGGPSNNVDRLDSDNDGVVCETLP